MNGGSSSAGRNQRIASDGDVVQARQMGRELAAALGFGRPDQALIATAISELARNIVNYAGEGWIEVSPVSAARKKGLKVVARDDGPGIADLASAMTDGFSTGNSLGLGLPGARRIMDEFDIRSAPGEGVQVVAVKWMR